MHRPYQPEHAERSVRYDVPNTIVSGVVPKAGFAVSLPISSPFSATSAATADRAALDPQGPGSHVCSARTPLDLSRRIIRSGSSNAAEGDRVGVESHRDSANCVQRP